MLYRKKKSCSSRWWVVYSVHRWVKSILVLKKTVSTKNIKKGNTLKNRIFSPYWFDTLCALFLVGIFFWNGMNKTENAFSLQVCTRMTNLTDLLDTTWWQPDDWLMTAWWFPDCCLMNNAWQLPQKCWQMLNNWLVTAWKTTWKMPEKCLTTAPKVLND